MDQAAVAPLEILAPLKVTAVGDDDWQVFRVLPGVTTGAGVMVNVTRLVAAAQLAAWPVVVRVRVTVPALISAAEGVYTALSVFALGLYVPVPPDQVPPVAFVTEPARVIAGLVEQTVCAGPALATGAALMVTSLSDVTAEHPVGASVVRRSVTAVVELAVCVNVTADGVAVGEVLLSVPVPGLTMDQAPVVAPPPMVAPVKAKAEGLAVWHTVFGPAAFAVGAWLMVTVLVALTAGQGPAPSGSALVNVRMADP